MLTTLIAIATILTAPTAVHGTAPTLYAIDARTTCIVADNGTTGEAVCVGRTASTTYRFDSGQDPLEWKQTAQIIGRRCAAINTAGNAAIWYRNGRTHSTTYHDTGEIIWHRPVPRIVGLAMRAAIADANSTGRRAARIATVCR